jgi:uncharacterized protein YdeI (YjbR/CyaY-like superfamily)
MPEKNERQLERFYAMNRAEWRAWLEEHHATEAGVWLIYYKQHSSQPGVEYEEAVEEALCFGWIDSRTNTLDDERYIQLFSPRKPKSPWSKSNKQRVEKLMQRGLMAPAGLAAIEAAKRNGSWNIYDAIENLSVAEDFRAALAANPAALKNFEAFSASTKKQILWHIESAKRPETRARRIQQIVESAEQNRNPLNYVQNKKVREA